MLWCPPTAANSTAVSAGALHPSVAGAAQPAPTQQPAGSRLAAKLAGQSARQKHRLSHTAAVATQEKGTGA